MNSFFTFSTNHALDMQVAIIKKFSCGIYEVSSSLKYKPK